MIAILSSSVISRPDAGSEYEKGERVNNSKKLPSKYVNKTKNHGNVSATYFLWWNNMSHSYSPHSEQCYEKIPITFKKEN